MVAIGAADLYSFIYTQKLSIWQNTDHTDT